MSERELRHMSRAELIEIIYAQKQEEHSLRQENEDLKRRLRERSIRMKKAGSIAEAALSLNHIFEDAQAAADQYLLSVKRKADAQVHAAKQQAGAKQEEEE